MNFVISILLSKARRSRGSPCCCLCRYVKFDTFHPAVQRGLPVTRVISRVTLQNILAEACYALGGKDVISNGTHVVDFQEQVSMLAAGTATPTQPVLAIRLPQPSCLLPQQHSLMHQEDPVTGSQYVEAITEDGQRIRGDILIGADGIRSKVQSARYAKAAHTGQLMSGICWCPEQLL